MEEEQKAADETKAAQDESARVAAVQEKEKLRLMEVMKAKLKEAMWKQLKEAQAVEVAKIEAKRKEIASKFNGPKKERPNFNVGA